MGKIIDKIKAIKQHHHVKKLISFSMQEYANDSDVIFHVNQLIDEFRVSPKFYDAIHGVNTTEEMMNSAVSVTD
jgi:hypothetical protein